MGAPVPYYSPPPPLLRPLPLASASTFLRLLRTQDSWRDQSQLPSHELLSLCQKVPQSPIIWLELKVGHLPPSSGRERCTQGDSPSLK